MHCDWGFGGLLWRSSHARPRTLVKQPCLRSLSPARHPGKLDGSSPDSEADPNRAWTAPEACEGRLEAGTTRTVRAKSQCKAHLCRCLQRDINLAIARESHSAMHSSQISLPQTHVTISQAWLCVVVRWKSFSEAFSVHHEWYACSSMADEVTTSALGETILLMVCTDYVCTYMRVSVVEEKPASA